MDYEQLLPLEIIKEYAKVDSDAVASDALLQMFREVAFATYTAFTGEDLTSYKDCVEAVTLKKFPYPAIYCETRQLKAVKMTLSNQRIRAVGQKVS